MPEQGQTEENGKRSQLNPEHTFDPSHLKDSAQDTGNDGMNAGQGLEPQQEDEMEMGM